MNHHEIEEGQVIDLYLMGRLTSDRAEEFEQHYLHCNECLERIQTAEKFQRGLKRAVAQDAARTIFGGHLGLLARLAKSRRAGWMVAMAITLAVGTLAYREYRESNRLSGELEETKLALAQTQEIVATRPPPASPAEPQAEPETFDPERAEMAAKTQRLEDDLRREQQARASLAQQLKGAFETQLTPIVATLNPLRDAAFGVPASPNRILLSEEPRWVFLTLDFGRPQFETYRIHLVRVEDKEVGSYEGLMPTPDETIRLSLHSSRLEAGEYVAQLEGTPAGGDSVPVTRFGFRIVRDSE